MSDRGRARFSRPHRQHRRLGHRVENDGTSRHLGWFAVNADDGGGAIFDAAPRGAVARSRRWHLRGVDVFTAARREDHAEGRGTSTVLGPDGRCDDSVPRENQPFLDNLTWDIAHGELVAGGSRTTARPLHDLYTLVWRIRPNGEYRRVLFGKKVTKVSPAKHHLDGVSAMAVDPKGRIFIISRLMVFEQRGWDELR